MNVDLREKNVGDAAPGGALIDECPVCKKPGLHLTFVRTDGVVEVGYAHVVTDNFIVVEGCVLPLTGGQA